MARVACVGIIGLGKNHDRSVGYSLAKELFRKIAGNETRLLVNSRTSSTTDLFFQHGAKEILEQNVGSSEWEQRFSYRRCRTMNSVEDIVKDSVKRATYEQIAEQAELVVVSLEAQLPTIEITPELARRSELRREIYHANALEMRKIMPAFRNYKGLILMVTNPPSWHCMDWYEQTCMKAEQIAGVHPETHRLRDYTGIFSYLQHQGIEVNGLEGIERVYVLGDHGGCHMVVPLSTLVVRGKVPASFRPTLMRKGIAGYVNQLANQMLAARKSTSHEIAALVSRMVQSHYSKDEEEYVLAVYTNRLGNGKAVFSGEPAVFRKGSVEARSLDFLNEMEKAEYEACLEGMRKTFEERKGSLSRRSFTLPLYFEERLFKVPLLS